MTLLRKLRFALRLPLLAPMIALMWVMGRRRAKRLSGSEGRSR